MQHPIIPYPELPSKILAKKLVVLLHGVGSDGRDLITLAPILQQEFNDYHFIAPNGVEQYDMAPFGYQWFSLLDRTPSVLQQRAYHNLPLLRNIINDQQTRLGLDNSQTIIIGFSQGTMIGMLLTLSQQSPFAAMIGFSGRLIPPTEYVNTQTPICLIHGEEDQIVPVSEMHNAISELSKHHIPNQHHVISNLAHSIDDTGLDLAISFLKQNK